MEERDEQMRRYAFVRSPAWVLLRCWERHREGSGLVDSTPLRRGVDRAADRRQHSSTRRREKGINSAKGRSGLRLRARLDSERQRGDINSRNVWHSREQ